MGGVIALVYGVASYVLFLASFLYAIGFVGNFAVPKSIDSGAAPEPAHALLVDALLLGLFAIQHSVMARPGFKTRFTRLVPAAVERSTFVLVTSLLLVLLYAKWQPLTTPLWSVETPALRALLFGLFGLGWLLVLVSTFAIDHFDLFGLRQVWLRFRGRPYTQRPFTTTGLYGVVRHPIMLGFVIAFWATPEMTLGHVLFAVATTGYIAIALPLEERDLVSAIGDAYRSYQGRVPMLVPRLWRR
jgi:protein-S-isoprenylcysteine O-methyltransferase Ste14